MKKINNKGFTLVELLATMVILGIITGISMPLLRNVMARREYKKYDTYQESLIYASKLYVDSYKEDLFGYSKSGCAYIDLKDLIDKKFIKDIDIPSVTCNTPKTYVNVIKVGDKYTYTPYLTCQKTKEDEENNISVSEYTYPSGDYSKDLACGIDSQFNMTIYPSKFTSATSSRRQDVKIIIDSYTGIKTNLKLSYAFSRTGDINDIISTWQTVPIVVEPEEEQMKKIENNQIISATSETILTPTNLSGDLYLVLRVDYLLDLEGESWSKNESRYLQFGPYTSDISAPRITKVETINNDGVWQRRIKIQEYGSEDKKLFVCEAKSNDYNECDRSLYPNQNSQHYHDIYDTTIDENSGDASLIKFAKYNFALKNNALDYCIKASDRAGNTSTTKCSTRTEYVIHLYSESNTEYSTPITVVTSTNTIGETWPTLPAVTKTGYTCQWHLNSNTGNIIVPGITFQGSLDAIRLYSVCNLNQYSINYKMNGGRNSSSNPTSYNVNSGTITLVSPTKTGYRFLGWTKKDTDLPKIGLTIKGSEVRNLTITAHWQSES